MRRDMQPLRLVPPERYTVELEPVEASSCRCLRPHDFATSEIVISKAGEVRHLYPVPGGFKEEKPQ